MSKNKWYGKLIYTREGVEQFHEFETEAEAKAYCKGLDDAFELTKGSDDCDLTDEYYSYFDQVKPENEQ